MLLVSPRHPPRSPLATAHAAPLHVVARRVIPRAWLDVQVNTDLLGGSGGSIGGETVHQVLGMQSAGSHLGYGGAGGGVLELVAVNDIIVSEGGSIHLDGEDGEDSFRGGVCSRNVHPVISSLTVAVQLSPCSIVPQLRCW